jgi:beta-lactamase regulating signal transducer with metallopeptidase domain
LIGALLDHLWQSTLFAGCAGLLTLALRHNEAKTRYWLWFAASVKFLIPFSLLVDFGAALAPPILPMTTAVAKLQFVARAGAPFSQSLPPAAQPGLNALTALFTLWLAGVFAVLLIWFCRWRRVHVVLREAKLFALAAPIPVKVTASTVGPGLFGIFRPVLLLPEGITQNLTQLELRAILDHELCHWERSDNLTASIHMLAEALFWFHPLVWWLGGRLIAARERACDESVVAYGNEAGVYADSILKVCRFYAIPPPPIAAAVLSTDLQDRIHGIMDGQARAELSNAQKMLIAACAALVIALPMMTGWSRAVLDEIYRPGVLVASGDATQAALRHSIAQLQMGVLHASERPYDVDLGHEDTTSRTDCEDHFLALLQVLEKSYGRFVPLYPPRAKNDQDLLPISLTWKNGLGTSRYQEATVYMSAETAHVWDARRLFDGRTIDAAAEWSADSKSATSVCLTEIDLKA